MTSPSDTSTLPRRRQEDRREEAKTRILEAAVQLLAQKGFDFTLAEVGEAAGYSRGLPAHYFGSKDDLLYAIARHVVRTFREKFAAGHRSGEGLESLIALVEFYFLLADEDPTNSSALHHVLAQALDNEGLRGLLVGLNRGSRNGFKLEIETGIAAGDIREDVDAPALAALILATLRGVNALSLIDSSLDRAAVRRAFVDMLRRALAK